MTERHRESSWVHKVAGNEVMGAVARLMQVIGMPMIIGLGGWLSVSIEDMKQAITRLETQMVERTQDRYSATDAKRDMNATDFRFNNNERRIEQINARLMSVENALRDRK